MIEVLDIQPKSRKGSINTAPRPTHTVYNAEIEPGKSIRLFGIHQNKKFEVSFNLGDIAEYDSYNLHYLGEIVKITQNSVTIHGGSTGRGNKRLSLYEFSWRNYDFDEDQLAKKNYETSLVI